MTTVHNMMVLLCFLLCLSSLQGARKKVQQRAGPTCPASRSAVLKDEFDRQNAGISSADRALKYDKMAASSFAFYRGSAHLFYKDVTEQGWLDGNKFDEAVWISGDLHLENFGSIQDTQGDVVEVINDFDESYVASYLYDVWRLAVSMVIVSRTNGEGSDKDLKEIVSDSFVSHYLDTVEGARQNPSELLAKESTKTAETGLQKFLKKVERKESRERMLSKWTSSGRFLIPHPKGKLGNPSNLERLGVSAAIENYSPAQPMLQGDSAYFRVKDVARRLLAGTGSLGEPRFYVLVEGPSSSEEDDVILDVKQTSYPAIHEYASAQDRERMAIFSASGQGQRVAFAQLVSNNNVDATLGHTVIDGEPFLVRQRNPFKKTFDSEKLSSRDKLKDFAAQLGQIVARSHSRSDKTFSNQKNPVTWDFPAKMVELVKGKQAEFSAQVLERAVAYADQVVVDHECFSQLVAQAQLN